MWRLLFVTLFIKTESLKIDILDLIIDTWYRKNCDRVEKQQ